MSIILSLALLFASVTACQEFRQTELGATLEIAAETSIEHAIEAVTTALGFPIEIEIDYDPANNAHPKCRNCSIHCLEDDA